VVTNDDHAALIEVEGQLDELRGRHGEAEDAADRSQLQAQIDAAEAERVDILRRTHPEDMPKL
jgi:hypothetical protein